MLDRLDRFAITPERYALVARFALVMLTLIVLTGAAVRVTGSGLGCPTWPKCTDTSLYTQLTTHGVIEFGNRVLTFFVARLTRFDILFLVVLLVRGMAGSLAFWNKKRPRQMVVAGFIAEVSSGSEKM